MQKQESIVLGVNALLERLIAQTDQKFAKLEKSGSLTDLCVAFFHFCETYEQIDALRKKLYHLLDAIDKVTIPEAFVKEGVDKIAIPELEHSFYPLDKYSASMKDKEEAFKWLRSNGMSELITETCNAGTLAARIKEMVLTEGKDPPECIDFKSYKITGMSKYKPKLNVKLQAKKGG